jgi:hypothetical protein
MNCIRIYIILLCVSSFSCDTTDNINPPDESYFVKFYGGAGDQQGVDMAINSDGTLLLFGNTFSENNGRQFYVVNVDANGQVIWENTYGGPNDEEAKDIELTGDGRIVIVGNTITPAGDTDILIMTLMLDGTRIDSATFGLPDNTMELATSVTQVGDGFIVTGSTTNLDQKPEGSISGEIRDALHVRFFDNLASYPSIWRVAHGPGQDDIGTKIYEKAPNLYYFFGHSNASNPGDSDIDQNFWILELGADGETIRQQFLANTPTNEILSSVVQSPMQSGEGYLLTGVISNTLSGSSQAYTVKLRRDLNFNSDILFAKDLDLSLGLENVTNAKAFPATSGFIIVSNVFSNGVQKLYLTKINNDLNPSWQNPEFVLLGGEQGAHNDEIGAVAELPGGQLVILGTIRTGQEGESKMALFKVNKDGKFLN